MRTNLYQIIAVLAMVAVIVACTVDFGPKDYVDCECEALIEYYTGEITTIRTTTQITKANGEETYRAKRWCSTFARKYTHNSEVHRDRTIHKQILNIDGTEFIQRDNTQYTSTNL